MGDPESNPLTTMCFLKKPWLFQAALWLLLAFLVITALPTWMAGQGDPGANTAVMAEGDMIRARADAWGYVFDTWWVRVTGIISLLINLGVISTKAGRESLTQLATLGTKKPK